MIPSKIKECWAVIATDVATGEDFGIPATMERGVMTPLVAADPDRVSFLRDVAKKNAASAAVQGKRMTLVRFSMREDLETFEP